ncbi:MAG: TIGR02117 family protein, partial [Pseudomonadales bacterium]
VAAIIGALVPRNAGWQEREAGVLVWVRSNGVHAELVLPAQVQDIDWYQLLPPEDVRDPARAQGWIGIGWGQRDFYLETPTWDDLTARTALRAPIGGSALMHVGHLSQPRPGRWHRPVRLAPHDYRKLANAVLADFVRDPEGRTMPLAGAGYSRHDAFYEAHGHYHAFRTSNVWTGDMLAVAGVRIGVWTPFEQSIMWRFPGDAR